MKKKTTKDLRENIEILKLALEGRVAHIERITEENKNLTAELNTAREGIDAIVEAKDNTISELESKLATIESVFKPTDRVAYFSEKAIKKIHEDFEKVNKEQEDYFLILDAEGVFYKHPAQEAKKEAKKKYKLIELSNGFCFDGQMYLYCDNHSLSKERQYSNCSDTTYIIHVSGKKSLSLHESQISYSCREFLF